MRERTIVAGCGILLMFLLSLPALGQTPPARVMISGQYAWAVTSHDGVTGADGPGIDIHAEYRRPGIIGLGLSIGYARIGISQDAPIDRWNWPYWEIYYGHESQQLRDQPDFEAVQTPVQRALVLSGALLPSLNFQAGALGLQLAAGPSAVYYSRRLYLDEHWSRYYPEVDYTFDMRFRNYAEDKNGLEVGADVRLTAFYRLSSLVHVTVGAHYRRLFRDASSDFPMSDLLAGRLGLAFTY